MILVDGIQEHVTSLRYKRWSHMVSTTGLAELHLMADRIGLKHSWFQPNSFAHYDIVPAKRTLAIQLGAIEVDARLLLFCNFDYAIKRSDRVIPEPYATLTREAIERWRTLRDSRWHGHVATCDACLHEANAPPARVDKLCPRGLAIWRS